MGLLDECSEYFGCESLYEVLSVDKNATATELKKAYRKASLLLHPDKVKESEKEGATKKFQVLSRVHYILSDTERRAFYDETGSVDGESITGDESADFWTEYWRALFPKLTLKDIDNFMASYTGSDEELKDLKECYLKYEGNMSLISESFIGYKAEEEDRFRKILNDLIEKKEIPSFPKFVNEKPAKRLARVKKSKKEASEVAEMESSETLVNMLAKRAKDRESSFNSMISNLEAKYGAKEPKGKKKKRV